MTKPVTSVAALILVEEGRIGLEDPVDKHLPQFASLRVRQPDGPLGPASRPPADRGAAPPRAGGEGPARRAPPEARPPALAAPPGGRAPRPPGRPRGAARRRSASCSPT